MRIIYTGAFRFPNGDAAAARTLNNARLLRDLGHSVRFIAWGGKYNPEHLCADNVYRFDGFEYEITNEIDLTGNIFHKTWQILHQGSTTLKSLSMRAGTYDCVIFYNSGFYFTKRLINLSEKLNIKIVHDLTEWYEKNEIPFFMRSLYRRNMLSLQFKVKNKIVISSYLGNFYNNSNNVFLPPLCDSQDNKWQNSVSDHRIKPFKGITLIYAGNPAKKDKLHTVVNVINQLVRHNYSIRMIICGISRNQYLQQYAQLIDNDLSENIIFVGRIQQEMVPAYYKLADFMILLRDSSRKNQAGFPTKVAESITAGVPVITNNTSDLSAFIKNGYNGFLLEDNSEEFVLNFFKDHILTLESTQLQVMKTNAQESKRLFDFRSYINSVAQFIHTLK